MLNLILPNNICFANRIRSSVFGVELKLYVLLGSYRIGKLFSNVIKKQMHWKLKSLTNERPLGSNHSHDYGMGCELIKLNPALVFFCPIRFITASSGTVFPPVPDLHEMKTQTLSRNLFIFRLNVGSETLGDYSHYKETVKRNTFVQEPTLNY